MKHVLSLVLSRSSSTVISQNESCRSNHRTPVMLIPILTMTNPPLLKYPKKSNLLDRTPFSINIQRTLLPRWSPRLESGGSDYMLVPDSVVTPFSASRTSSSVDWEASLRSIRLWNQTALDLRHHSSNPMTVMPDMITIA